MKMYTVVSCFLVSLLSFENVEGSFSLEGVTQQEFIFSYPKSTTCHMDLIVSGKPGTKVSIKSRATEIGSITIDDTQRGNITLPNTVCYTKSETISDESVQISASDNIFAVISGLNSSKNAEATAIFPVSFLSKKYFVATVQPEEGEVNEKGNQAIMTITALLDNTTIRITLGESKCSANSSLTSGGILDIKLDKYEAYGIYCDSDITGTMVESSFPVAVLSGRARAVIPFNGESRDLVFSMMPPVEMYGTEYVLHNLGQAPGVYRAVAASNNTVIDWGNNTSTLNQGDHVDIDTSVSGETCLRSSIPVLVMVFYKSGKFKPWNGTDYGDPFMATVPATHQFQSSYLVPYVPKSNIVDYQGFIVLVVKKSHDKKPIYEMLEEELRVPYTESTLSDNTYSVIFFELNEQGVISFGFPFSFGVMFIGLGFRAGLAFFGHSIELQSTTSTPTTIITTPTSPISTTTNITSNTTASTSTAITFINQLTNITLKTTTSLTTTTKTTTKTTATSTSFIITTTTSMTSPSTTISATTTPNSPTSTIKTTTLLTTIATPTTTPTATTTITSTTTTTTTTTTSTTTTTMVQLDKNGHPVRTVSTKCTCFCKNKDRLDVYTEEAAEGTKEKIREELVVKTKTLAKTTAKKTSAKDSRTSANTIGWLGIALLILPALLVVGGDLLNLCSYIRFNHSVDATNDTNPEHDGNTKNNAE